MASERKRGIRARRKSWKRLQRSKLGRMAKATHKEENEKLMDEVDKDFMTRDSEMLESLNRPFDIPEIFFGTYISWRLVSFPSKE